MAANANETSPLLPISTSSSTDKKAPRQVTFSPNPTIVSPGGTTSSRGTPSVPPILPQHQLNASSGLASINDKLRRRNSAGAPGTTTLPKIGPQRTTKNAEKLKFLPNIEFGEDGPDEESGRDVYSQYTRIKDPTARRDAARLGKADRDRLPRVRALRFLVPRLVRHWKSSVKFLYFMAIMLTSRRSLHIVRLASMT
jgi:hypothetical protein